MKSRYHVSPEGVERVGFLLCALFLGLLIGWVGGTWTAIRNLSDCVERAD